MATLIVGIYDALKSVGVDDSKAKAAAEAVALYDPKLAAIESELKLHRWILWINTALILAVLGIVFSILQKLN